MKIIKLSFQFVNIKKKGGKKMTEAERDKLLLDLKLEQEKISKTQEEKDAVWEKVKNNPDRIFMTEKEKKIIWDGKLARLEMITENGEKE